jgi:hypothetical protein
VVSFGFFFDFWGIFNLKSLGFLTRNETILGAKIVVKTWWLSAKTWSFGGCCPDGRCKEQAAAQGLPLAIEKRVISDPDDGPLRDDVLP